MPVDVTIESPQVSDGAAMWRVARDSGPLDLNSSYAYLLWCKDFAGTSVVARVEGGVEGRVVGDVVGFVTGYLRPAARDTLMVWQVAVDSDHRGTGLAATMLDSLIDRLRPTGVRYLETTVTEDNAASNRLFRALAKRRSAGVDRTELFGPADFPDHHDVEFRYRIGPF